jgi:hypothetical protein
LNSAAHSALEYQALCQPVAPGRRYRRAWTAIAANPRPSSRRFTIFSKMSGYGAGVATQCSIRGLIWGSHRGALASCLCGILSGSLWVRTVRPWWRWLTGS